MLQPTGRSKKQAEASEVRGKTWEGATTWASCLTTSSAHTIVPVRRELVWSGYKLKVPNHVAERDGHSVQDLVTAAVQHVLLTRSSR